MTGRAWRVAMLAATVSLGLGPLGPGAAARAEDITAEQAQVLQRQLRDVLAGLLGPHVALGDAPLPLTAEDDHYRLALPVAGLAGAAAGMKVEAEPVTANLRPLEGGRWEIDNLHFPSPVKLSFANADGAQETLTLAIETQEQHAVFDPSLASPSRWDGKLHGYSQKMEGGTPPVSRDLRIEEMEVHGTLTPAADGRTDVQEQTESRLIASNATVPNVGVVAASVARATGSLRMQGVAPAGLTPIIQAAATLWPRGVAAAKDASAPAPPLTAEERAAVRAALTAAVDLMSGFEEESTLEDVRFSASGHSGHVGKMVVGLRIGAPEGRAALHLDIRLDGLESADVPQGVLRTYMPRHIEIAPRIGGVPARDLRALVLRAADSQGDDPALKTEAEALMRKGPVAVGLDALALDFGPAAVRGTGELRIFGQDDMEGEAHVTATGLDTLIQQANTTPELKQGVPVLFMLKGLGRQDGGTTVWDITYRGKKVLVNGTDLSGLMPKK